jgi:hypothetical protein
MYVRKRIARKEGCGSCGAPPERAGSAGSKLSRCVGTGAVMMGHRIAMVVGERNSERGLGTERGLNLGPHASIILRSSDFSGPSPFANPRTHWAWSSFYPHTYTTQSVRLMLLSSSQYSSPLMLKAQSFFSLSVH